MVRSAGPGGLDQLTPLAAFATVCGLRPGPEMSRPERSMALGVQTEPAGAPVTWTNCALPSARSFPRKGVLVGVGVETLIGVGAGVAVGVGVGEALGAGVEVAAVEDDAVGLSAGRGGAAEAQAVASVQKSTRPILASTALRIDATPIAPGSMLTSLEGPRIP